MPGACRPHTTITSDEPDRANVDNMSTTFLTVLPEDVADRDVWNPGSTARESVDRLGRFAQWAADAGLTIAIIGGPILVVAAILVGAVRTVKRRRRASGPGSDVEGTPAG